MTSGSSDDESHHRQSAGKRTARANRENNGLDREDASPGYEVGYKRPPKNSRVRKGEVLNPGGRPKGAKNKPKEISGSQVRTIVLNEARRKVQANDATGPLTITMIEAAIRALAVNAVKGNVRAQREFIAATRAAEREENADQASLLVGVIEYRLGYEAELKRRKELGIKGPDLVLHPDDMVIEQATGKLHIRGPATAKETVRWQQLRESARADLRELKARRADPNHRNTQKISDQIVMAERTLKIIENALNGSREAMVILEKAISED
jgi:hypothetical protein